MPVVPGDKFRVKTESLVRLAPLVAPMMHRVNVFTHYFFVPNRLVWNEWEDFITKGVDGDDVPVLPSLRLSPDLISSNPSAFFGDGTLWDYLGLPSLKGIGGAAFPNPSPNGVMAPQNYRVSSLPFRAYQLIYNEYYRDQNLTDPVDISLNSGFEDTLRALNLLLLRRRAWEKDYFTSALPWLQRGPEVTVPVQGSGGSLDVVYDTEAKTTQRWIDSDNRSFENGVAYDAVFSMEGNPRLSRLVAVNGGVNNRAPELNPNGTLKVNVLSLIHI